MAGQIIERGKNIYLVRMFMGRDENGKRVYHNKTIYGNKKAAQAYLNKILRERDTGEFTEPSKEFLSNYLDKWMETAVKSRVREKTYDSYKGLIRLYLKPKLGNIMLSNLTSLRIQEAYNSLSEEGLSARTVRYTHSVLRSALEQAVRWQMIQRNPTQYVDLPQQKKNEMRAMSPVEAKRFLDACICSKWQALFSLMITTGLRPGEAFGLKWIDIDFEQGKIRVVRTLTRNNKGWSLQEPKTPQSRRTIPLPTSVVQDLKNHKKNQAKEKLSAENYTDHGFVFAGETGEPLHQRNIIRRHFKPLLKSANLPLIIRLYDLRHTCATLLLSAGVNPKIVSERLGHASVTLTLDTYSHVLPDMQQEAAAELEKLLF